MNKLRTIKNLKFTYEIVEADYKFAFKVFAEGSKKPIIEGIKKSRLEAKKALRDVIIRHGLNV